MTQYTNSHRHILWATLILVALLATLSNLTSPIFEPPDELLHYQYVRHLLDQRTLPVQELDGDLSQSHQPPLYYLAGAALVAGIDDPEEIPERNPFWGYLAGRTSRDNKWQYLKSDAPALERTQLVVHVLRGWSTALALITVFATWKLGCHLWSTEPLKVATMMSIGVLNPMFLYIAGAANNDNLVTLCGALILLLTARALSDDFAWRTTILIGLVWATALLSKLTGLVMSAAWGTALAISAWRKTSPRLFLSRLGAILGIAAIISGWWYIRNMLVYGEPLALQRMLAVWGSRDELVPIWLWRDLVYSWTTLWGRFGYGQVPLPRLFYWALLMLPVIGVRGIARRFTRSSSGSSRVESCKWIWAALATALAAYVAALLYYILRNTTGANGRYIFPALPAMAALLVAGISAGLDRIARPALLAITIGMLVLAVFAIGLLLPWTYAGPRMLDDQQVQSQVDQFQAVVWDDTIRLVGTALSPLSALAGEEVSLTACWRAEAAMDTNYTLFTHLLDYTNRSLGQRDTYPGLGTFPTSAWQTGNQFCDTILIPVTRELTQTAVAHLEIGFYDLETRQHLTAKDANGIPLDRVIVDQIKIQPPTPYAETSVFDHQTELRFDQGLALVGYSWDRDQVGPGATASVTLAWAPSGPLDLSYHVFAHLLDASGEIITQDDGLPQGGNYPTDYWGAGERILDERRFTIPYGIGPGSTRLRLGFYQLEDGRRLARHGSSELLDSAELAGPDIVGP